MNRQIPDPTEILSGVSNAAEVLGNGAQSLQILGGQVVEGVKDGIIGESVTNRAQLAGAALANPVLATTVGAQKLAASPAAQWAGNVANGTKEFITQDIPQAFQENYEGMDVRVQQPIRSTAVLGVVGLGLGSYGHENIAGHIREHPVAAGLIAAPVIAEALTVAASPFAGGIVRRSLVPAGQALVKAPEAAVKGLSGMIENLGITDVSDNFVATFLAAMMIGPFLLKELVRLSPFGGAWAKDMKAEAENQIGGERNIFPNKARTPIVERLQKGGSVNEVLDFMQNHQVKGRRLKRTGKLLREDLGPLSAIIGLSAANIALLRDTIGNQPLKNTHLSNFLEALASGTNTSLDLAQAFQSDVSEWLGASDIIINAADKNRLQENFIKPQESTLQNLSVLMSRKDSFLEEEKENRTLNVSCVTGSGETVSATLLEVPSNFLKIAENRASCLNDLTRSRANFKALEENIDNRTQSFRKTFGFQIVNGKLIFYRSGRSVGVVKSIG